MLPLVVIEEIRRLLDEGELSQRKIAAKLNISRGTVGAIASGQRGIYGREPQQDRPPVPELDLPPERCNCCGGMVHKPCLLCKTREYRRRHQRLAQFSIEPSHSGRRVA